jgi:hypothetical protein
MERWQKKKKIGRKGIEEGLPLNQGVDKAQSNLQRGVSKGLREEIRLGIPVMIIQCEIRVNGGPKQRYNSCTTVAAAELGWCNGQLVVCDGCRTVYAMMVTTQTCLLVDWVDKTWKSRAEEEERGATVLNQSV